MAPRKMKKGRLRVAGGRPQGGNPTRHNPGIQARVQQIFKCHGYGLEFVTRALEDIEADGKLEEGFQEASIFDGFCDTRCAGL